jgi:hypothetical protein
VSDWGKVIFWTLFAFSMGLYMVANPASFKKRLMPKTTIQSPILLHFLRAMGAAILALWGYLYYKAFTL